jgi:hypothetical protein
MSIFPVRNIAQGGVITDVDPYNLPLGAWSWGSNVRFRNGSVTRSPVFRNVNTALAQPSPRFAAAVFPSSGFDNIFIGYLNGKVSSILNGVETDYSVSGYTPSNSEDQFTSAHCADVFYMNREDRAPWRLKTSDTQFVSLENWPSATTCNLLRSSNSAMIAFGLVQSGIASPNAVMTSEFALAGNVPSTWDYTVGTNNATLNNLGEMESQITDANALGEIMVIYGIKETWLMVLDGSANIWSYQKLFSDQGAINANCSVEVDKKHYVFGLDDLWVHDGTTKQSICDERVREFIFSSLNVSQANRCRVVYNNNLKEINFQYVSGDQYCTFTGADGCNRQATYHIPTNTWSFDDLPFVFGAVMANLDTVETWAETTTPWITIGGTWYDQQDSAKKVMVMVGAVNSTYGFTESLYAYDLEGPGSLVSFSVNASASAPLMLFRDGIDLDQIGVDLKGYKLLSSIYPQCRFEPGADVISFQAGSADYFNQPVTFGDVQTYDGNTLYKLDYNIAGRYLSLKITYDDWHYMRLTGLDFDLDVTGEY